MNIGHVTGGTHAGWKKQSPKSAGWICPSCNKPLKGFWVACPNDNTRRPDGEED